MKPTATSAGEVVDEAELLRRARAARNRAYAPYSGFHVGAAVLTDDGRVYEAANVENAAYPLSACAEQNAIRAMACSGSISEVVAVAVVGDGEDPCTPCGACRQVIFEFGPAAMIYASGDGGRPLVVRLAELLPHGFGAKRLAEGQR